jgi:hypothetical protein
MDYKRVYDNIVSKALLENRSKRGEVYYESHHILPKCQGGDNSIGNLVLLTGREHFICHWLLTRAYPNDIKLRHAFWRMCNQKTDRQDRYIPSSIAYEEAKQAAAKSSSELNSGYNHTLEARDRISKAHKGKRLPIEEIQRREATRRLNGNTERSLDTRKKIGDTLRGIIKPKTKCEFCNKVIAVQNVSRHKKSCKQLKNK